MCGIHGIVSFDPDPRPLITFSTISANAHKTRGPDHQAARMFEVGRATCLLGHNRLSIIDLSTCSHQPMVTNDDQLAVTFNGEIYNYLELRDELSALGYRFLTQGDTEVILASYRAWGIRCVERFNGMFAFALLDIASRVLHLARDRFGVKPLYFVEDGARFAFSSTAGPLATIVGNDPNPAFVLTGLSSRVYEHDSETTQYARVHSVRAAHVYSADLSRDRQRVVRRGYYDLRSRVRERSESLAGASVSALTVQVRASLERSVSLRLRSDVPVGVSLSGGLDSSSVSAVASLQSSSLRAYTFGDPSRRDTEAQVAARFAEALDIPLTFVTSSPQSAEEIFWSCLEQQDCPFASTSVLAQFVVFRAARRDGIKVMLGGQGGDEAFMGYRKYFGFHLAEQLRSHRWSGALRAASNIGRVVVAERRHVSAVAAGIRRYSGRAATPSLFDLTRADSLFLGLDAGPLWERQAKDVYDTSLPTLLRYEDRNSMASSIESRLPFMDYELMELGLSVPTDVKLREGQGKWVLREAVRDLVPPEIVNARFKRGFDADHTDWFSGGLGRVLRGEVAQASAKLTPFLRRPLTSSDFSDECLRSCPGRFADAVTAVWLGRLLR